MSMSLMGTLTEFIWSENTASLIVLIVLILLLAFFIYILALEYSIWRRRRLARVSIPEGYLPPSPPPPTLPPPPLILNISTERLVEGRWGKMRLELSDKATISIMGEVDWMDPGEVEGVVVLPVKPKKSGSIPVTVVAESEGRREEKLIVVDVERAAQVDIEKAPHRVPERPLGDPVEFVERTLVGKPVEGLKLNPPNIQFIASGTIFGNLECRSVLGYNRHLSTITAVAVDRSGFSYVVKLFSHELLLSGDRAVIGKKTFKGAEELIDGYEVAMKLNHANIVRILEIRRDEFAVLTELCMGGSLRTVGGLNGKRLLEVLLPVLHALVKLHERGYVHGDVKPENILFTIEGIPKLCDFGLTAPIGSKQKAFTPPYTPRTDRMEPWLDVHAIAVILEEYWPNPDSQLQSILARAKGKQLSSREFLKELARYYLKNMT